MIIVAILAAASNTLWITGYLGATSQSTERGVLVDQSMVGMHIMIELALLVAAVGLLLRSVKGLVISIIALSWIGIEYILWFIKTQSIIKGAGLKQIPSLIPHAGNLYGATRWNLVVLIIVAFLFAWEVLTLIIILNSSSAKFPNKFLLTR